MSFQHPHKSPKWTNVPGTQYFSQSFFFFTFYWSRKWQSDTWNIIMWLRSARNHGGLQIVPNSHSREKWKSEQGVTLETVNTSMTQKHANELTTACWLTDDMINKVCHWRSFKEYGCEAFHRNCQINVIHSFICTSVLNSPLNEALVRYSTYILNDFSFCLAGVMNNSFSVLCVHGWYLCYNIKLKSQPDNQTDWFPVFLQYSDDLWHCWLDPNIL